MSQRRLTNIIGWAVAVAATVVYLLTMEPTVSFWDCGEFIATSQGLQIGHPPGAPLYTLLAHCFTLMAGSAASVAWWSNAMSAVAGGLTAMFLFWIIVRLLLQMAECRDSAEASACGDSYSKESRSRGVLRYLAALTGTGCYVFCDTAWFSACESEVYSLSMLFSAAIVWAMMRWAGERGKGYRVLVIGYRENEKENENENLSQKTRKARKKESGSVVFGERWLLLTALLMGLSVGVHQLSLLTVPVVIVIYFTGRSSRGLRSSRGSRGLRSSRGLKGLKGSRGLRGLRSSRGIERGDRRGRSLRLCGFALLFFVIGLTPYLIIPIRAAFNPPINMGDPSTAVTFRDYLTRKQYEHAPLIYGRCFNSPIVDFRDGKPVYAPEMDMLFPRMWKQHDNAEAYYCDWTGRHGRMVDVDGRKYYKPSFLDNISFFAGYQLGYMYMRYLMWNFSGRYNDRQGFGNLQKGQFITGIPFVDRMYIGTGKTPPPSVAGKGHNRYYMLPFLLGMIGIIAHFRRDKRGAWVVMTLFLMSSVLLSVYLNHPVYEPRERDYAYVLSFFAFAIWIGVGAYAVGTGKGYRLLVIGYRRLAGKPPDTLAHNSGKNAAEMHENGGRGRWRLGVMVLLLAVPVLMACENWDDHDRSGRYVARDSAANLLESCSDDAILFTYGDNDTFPLWYLQQVEGERRDVRIVNLSLLGSDSYCRSVMRDMRDMGISDEEMMGMGPHGRMSRIVGAAESRGARQVFFSHYAYNAKKGVYGGRMRLCGMAYRLDETAADSVDVDASLRLMSERMQWHNVASSYIDETCHHFLVTYWRDVLEVVEGLTHEGRRAEARRLMEKTMGEIPPSVLQDLLVRRRIVQACDAVGDRERCVEQQGLLRKDVEEQLRYYGSMSPTMLEYIPYSLEPLMEVRRLGLSL